MAVSTTDLKMINSLRNGARKGGGYISVQRDNLLRLITIMEEHGIVSEVSPVAVPSVQPPGTEIAQQPAPVPPVHAAQSQPVATATDDASAIAASDDTAGDGDAGTDDAASDDDTAANSPAS